VGGQWAGSGRTGSGRAGSGRAGGRAGWRAGRLAVYGHVITKFSGMGRFTYPWCSAGALRAPELRYKRIYRSRRYV